MAERFGSERFSYGTEPVAKMMKTLFLTFLMTFCIFFSQAELIEVNDMEEVFYKIKDVDSKGLVIFDVDMVLVQPEDPAFQMANMKRFSSIAKRIMKEVPADKQMIFLSLMTICSEPVLINSTTPQLMQKVMQRGVPVMGLTSNLTGEFSTIKNMEKWRVNALRCLGIDFDQAAPYKKNILFDDLPSYRGNYSTYLDGILFVNGTVVSKGDAFLSFLKKTELTSNKIVFIDDREDNLKSLEDAIQKRDKPIDYLGIHFTGAQNYPSKVISEQEFEARWQELASEAKKM